MELHCYRPNLFNYSIHFLKRHHCVCISTYNFLPNVHISSTDFKVIENSIFESTTHKITGESTVQGGIDLSSRTIFVDGQGIPQINNDSSVVNFGGRNLIMSDLDNSSDGLLKLETDEEFLMESKTRDRLEHTRQGTLLSGENFGLGHVINFDVGVG